MENKTFYNAALKNTVPCSGLEDAERIVNGATGEPTSIFIPTLSVGKEHIKAVMDLVLRGEEKGVSVHYDEASFVETTAERDLRFSNYMRTHRKINSGKIKTEQQNQKWCPKINRA